MSLARRSSPQGTSPNKSPGRKLSFSSFNVSLRKIARTKAFERYHGVHRPIPSLCSSISLHYARSSLSDCPDSSHHPFSWSLTLKQPFSSLLFYNIKYHPMLLSYSIPTLHPALPYPFSAPAQHPVIPSHPIQLAQQNPYSRLPYCTLLSSKLTPNPSRPTEAYPLSTHVHVFVRNDEGLID